MKLIFKRREPFDLLFTPSASFAWLKIPGGNFDGGLSKRGRQEGIDGTSDLVAEHERFPIFLGEKDASRGEHEGRDDVRLWLMLAPT